MGEVPYGIKPATQAPLYRATAFWHSEPFFPAKSGAVTGLDTSALSLSPSPDTNDAGQVAAFSFRLPHSRPDCDPSLRNGNTTNNLNSLLPANFSPRSLQIGACAELRAVSSETNLRNRQSMKGGQDEVRSS